MSDIKDSSKIDDDGTDEGKGKKCTQIKKFVEMRLFLEVLFIWEQKRVQAYASSKFNLPGYTLLCILQGAKCTKPWWKRVCLRRDHKSLLLPVPPHLTQVSQQLPCFCHQPLLCLFPASCLKKVPNDRIVSYSILPFRSRLRAHFPFRQRKGQQLNQGEFIPLRLATDSPFLMQFQTRE